MSAHDQIRAMLDQLMGTGRNGENNRFQVKFSDPRVCKSFLLGCCPHEILSSTRMDLGDCPKIHDLALRADYEQASSDKDYYYDIDAMEHLQAFIADCDRRTELAKRRLAETQEELSAEVAAKANKVHELAEQIGKKLARAEQLGAEGHVEESMRLMEEIEDLRKRKAAAEQEYRNSMPASSYQQQKLRVCEVCSAYLGIHDNDRRLADHFGGKLHLGFIKIREKLAELQKNVEERRRKKRDDRDRDDGGRGSSREAMLGGVSPEPARTGPPGQPMGHRRGTPGGHSSGRRSRSHSRSRGHSKASRSSSREKRHHSRSRSPRSRNRSRSRDRSHRSSRSHGNNSSRRRSHSKERRREREREGGGEKR